MAFVLVIILIIIVIKIITAQQYKKLEAEVLQKLGFSSWNVISYIDERVTVKSRQTLEKYNDVKFFKENREKLVRAETIIKKKNDIATQLRSFLENNEYKSRSQYRRVKKQIDEVLRNAGAYRISVNYISSAGNHLGEKEIAVKQYNINRFKNDPSLLMGKGEYNKYLKEQQKEALSKKQHEYYENVNNIIDYANKSRELLIIKGAQEEMDNLVSQLFDRTVNSIKKIKTIVVKNWTIIGDFINRHKKRDRKNCT